MICCNSLAQSRSGNVYEFLDMPTTSRMTALGGGHAILGVDEAGFVMHNPSVLTDTLSREVALNFTPIKGGIKSGSVSYVHYIDIIKGTMSGSVQYINYGSFDETDEFGMELGTFNVQEAALYLTYSRAIAPGLTMAATIKPIFSKYAEYNSFGLAMDMGATYRSKNDRIRTSVVLRNLGGQIKRFDGDEANESINTDMKVGLVVKPEHAPFRFTVTLKDIFHWDLSIDRKREITFGDNLFRHFILGAEFVPSDKFFVAFGYNHRQHKENRDSSVGGAAGISWGLGVKIAKIDISYGMGKYHTAGAANSITFSTNLNRFIKH